MAFFAFFENIPALLNFYIRFQIDALEYLAVTVFFVLFFFLQLTLLAGLVFLPAYSPVPFSRAGASTAIRKTVKWGHRARQFARGFHDLKKRPASQVDWP